MGYEEKVVVVMNQPAGSNCCSRQDDLPSLEARSS